MNKTMKKFITYLLRIIKGKGNLVYRLDNEKIKDFKENLRTYEHSPDWTISGAILQNQNPREGFHKSTGLFAGDLKAIAPYASPRGTSFLKYDNVIVFNKKDENKIMSHKSYLTSFKKNIFTKLEYSNEWFANDKNKIKVKEQKEIINPIKFMKKQGFEVRFVSNLKKEKKRLEKDERKQVDSEGIA